MTLRDEFLGRLGEAIDSISSGFGDNLEGGYLHLTFLGEPRRVARLPELFFIYSDTYGQ